MAKEVWILEWENLIRWLFCYNVNNIFVESVLESCIHAASCFLLNHKLSIQNMVDIWLAEHLNICLWVVHFWRFEMFCNLCHFQFGILVFTKKLKFRKIQWLGLRWSLLVKKCINLVTPALEIWFAYLSALRILSKKPASRSNNYLHLYIMTTLSCKSYSFLSFTPNPLLLRVSGPRSH